MFRRKKKINSRTVLLAVIYALIESKSQATSLPLLLDCLIRLKQLGIVDYQFYEGCFFAPALFSDLDELVYEGYLQQWEYREDALLPKTFYKLTILGTGKGKEILSSLPQKQQIANIVPNCICDDEKRWGLVNRSVITAPSI